jgi:hypothetical protein
LIEVGHIVSVGRICVHHGWSCCLIGTEHEPDNAQTGEESDDFGSRTEIRD